MLAPKASCYFGAIFKFDEMDLFYRTEPFICRINVHYNSEIFKKKMISNRHNTCIELKPAWKYRQKEKKTRPTRSIRVIR